MRNHPQTDLCFSQKVLCSRCNRCNTSRCNPPLPLPLNQLPGSKKIVRLDAGCATARPASITSLSQAHSRLRWNAPGVAWKMLSKSLDPHPWFDTIFATGVSGTKSVPEVHHGRRTRNNPRKEEEKGQGHRPPKNRQGWPQPPPPPQRDPHVGVFFLLSVC